MQSSATDRSTLDAFIEALDTFTLAQRRAQGRFNDHRTAGCLSLPQYRLLEPLAAAAAPQTLGALAEAAGVSPPTATRMLSGLEERGLVSRVRDPADRRLVLVALTEEGVRLVREKRDVVLAARRTIFDALSPPERDIAATLLRSLAAAIEDLHP